MSRIHDSRLLIGDPKIVEDIRAEVALCRDSTAIHSLDITVHAGVVDVVRQPTALLNGPVALVANCT